jgi:phosphinothricin acetyltransferase
MKLRPAHAKDAEALVAIYGHHVLHGFGTFEEAPPGADEMGARREAIQARGLPYLVAELDGEVAGFAYAAPFRTREAYRYTVEDSVYIAPTNHRLGLGKALLETVIAHCARMGLRQMLALIGDSDNAGSRGLHATCGFTETGVMTAVGFKAGRWVDVVVMQRSLNAGAAEPPDTAGLRLDGG